MTMEADLPFCTSGGGGMKWFGKEQPKEIWDETSAAPLGDIEAAERIRTICRSAADSAAVVAGHADGAGKGVRGNPETESERYQRAARAAMEIAMKVSDELMRDAAVREIVELCLKANDLKTAKILFRAIQSPTIRDPLLHDYPVLRA
jgi:hypothetical protein